MSISVYIMISVAGQVESNYQRRRVHTFEQVQTNVIAVRLNVTATNEFRQPESNAHVNEIRVYGPDGLAPFPEAPAGWERDLIQ